MLETRELYKVYKPKKGVPVVALNKISIKFPETGMIFLLGKSGSGKSTLLNLLGGLDKYDNGEIIIKGISSKNFKQQYFDSYRNTYVGFIFQEYNILNEFTVGANIALAIELQGRKASDEEINKILKEVDLEGYGNRKPNELSGGQKQRVAIARALVKNPEIIMADEPTGALDSTTGKQVFDTLKKLSKNKLVIIVSHDREFSEQYADRIIELADGNVISDVEISENQVTENIKDITYNNNLIEITSGYHLTEEDRNAINTYMDSLKDNNLILQVSNKTKCLKKFVKTDESKIKEQDGKSFKLIKSKLPMKSSFKIGASGLKYKKFRLVMTVLLSCIAFGLFGLADTFGAYNHVKTCTNSLLDSGVQSIALVKSVKHTYTGGQYWNSYGNKISEKELQQIEDNTGIELNGVVKPNGLVLDFSKNINPDVKLTDTDYSIYCEQFGGVSEIDQNILDNLGYKLVAGTIPDGSKNELAISSYVFETFKKGQYSSDQKKFDSINSYEDMVGKTLTLNETEYAITGVVDTKLNLDRYLPLTEKKEYTSASDEIVNYALSNEMYYETSYSLAGAMMVGKGHTEKMLAGIPNREQLVHDFISFSTDNYGINPEYITKLGEASEVKINWLDGEKTLLGDNEIIISDDTFTSYNNVISDLNDILGDAKNNNFNMNGYISKSEENITKEGVKVVGIIENSNKNWKGTVITSDSMYNKYASSGDGKYLYVTGQMPSNESELKDLVSYSYRTDSDTRFEIQNAVTYELDTVNSILKTLSKVFLYVGLGFALFAAVMLANFIATSINHKKQEIGILRAIGSRSNDVFRIFASESFIIAMINFILSTVGVCVVTNLINSILRKHYGILITVLDFSFRQVLLLLGISILVAAAASFIPVKRIASKRPIDAIRNR